MEVQIKECDLTKTIVTISCKEVTGTVNRLKKHIEMFDERLRGKYGNEYIYVNVTDIVYMETVDNRTFLYTGDKVLEVNYKLYELEELLEEHDFFRSSKAQIININKIKKLRPEINRTMMATMCTGEIVYISRRYAKKLKELLRI